MQSPWHKVEPALPGLYRPRKELTIEEACKIVLLDDWLIELDGVAERIRTGAPNYKILSRLWEDQTRPDELDDAARLLNY